MKRALLLALLAGTVTAQEPVGISLCTYRLDVRIVVINATATTAQQKLVETFVEYQDTHATSPYGPRAFDSRAEAQARARQILSEGFQRLYFPAAGGGTATGVYEQWYGPSSIARVQVTPQGYGGDPGHCVGS